MNSSPRLAVPSCRKRVGDWAGLQVGKNMPETFEISHPRVKSSLRTNQNINPKAGKKSRNKAGNNRSKRTGSILGVDRKETQGLRV